MQPNNLPKHVLVIPDGNRRWAKAQMLFPSEGHTTGARRFSEISKTAFEIGIAHFTLWVGSAANLKKRSPAEIQVLVSLLRHEIEKKTTLENCLRSKIRFRVVGSWFEISHDIHLRHAIQALQDQTRACGQHFLTILFGYSGIADAVEIVKNVCRHPPRHIDEETPGKASLVHELPPVDLVIRTGSERPNWTHVSDGILSPWLAPNSQIYSPQILWPDFTEDDFRNAVAVYSTIPRRFGK